MNDDRLVKETRDNYHKKESEAKNEMKKLREIMKLLQNQQKNKITSDNLRISFIAYYNEFHVFTFFKTARKVQLYLTLFTFCRPIQILPT